MVPLPHPEDGEEGGRPEARGMERFVEGVVAKCMKQMTTAYVVRAIEYVEDVACDIRIVREGL